MTVEGKNILLYFLLPKEGGGTEYVPTACAKNCTINMQSKFLKITNPATVAWEESLPQIKGWSIKGEGLVNYEKRASSYMIQNSLKEDKKVKIKVQYDDENNHTFIFSGYGFIKNISQNAPVSGFSSFSYSIVGTGEPSIFNNFDEGGDEPTPPEETFTLEWGFFSQPVEPQDLPVTLDYNKEIVKGSDYEIKKSEVVQGLRYVVIKEPSTEPVKVSWLSGNMDSGSIPDYTFMYPQVVGSDRYYITNIPITIYDQGGIKLMQ